mmetsp:Transcript_15723/g.36904  ORF Transcript_15723/g.36904 Transcript_15723/m.36904 type:complete len:454 (+) Transcript_15723:68-1429(+)
MFNESPAIEGLWIHDTFLHYISEEEAYAKRSARRNCCTAPAALEMNLILREYLEGPVAANMALGDSWKSSAGAAATCGSVRSDHSALQSTSCGSPQSEYLLPDLDEGSGMALEQLRTAAEFRSGEGWQCTSGSSSPPNAYQCTLSVASDGESEQMSSRRSDEISPLDYVASRRTSRSAGQPASPLSDHDADIVAQPCASSSFKPSSKGKGKGKVKGKRQGANKAGDSGGSCSDVVQEPSPSPAEGRGCEADCRRNSGAVEAGQDAVSTELRGSSGRGRKGANVKLWCHFYLDVAMLRDEGFALIKKIIGTGGEKTWKIHHATGAKVRVRGKGSGHKEADGREAPVPLMLAVTLPQSDPETFRRAITMAITLLEEVEEKFNSRHHDEKCSEHHHVRIGDLSDAAKEYLRSHDRAMAMIERQAFPGWRTEQAVREAATSSWYAKGGWHKRGGRWW